MIAIHDHGAVRELRLARPPVNALSPELLKALVEAVAAAPGEGSGALVVSGSEGMFTAGLDIPALLRLDRDELSAALGIFFDAMAALASSPIPVAAAITGHSPAGGFVLALFCDWRVMADGPFGIGLNEVRVGIPMPWVVAEAAARLIGRRQAAELCTTGRLLSPSEALRIGAVDAVVPAGEVVAEACRWCNELVALPARAVRLTREVVRSELVDMVRRDRVRDRERLLDEWFRPETQEALRQMVARIKGGRS
jgi:enoyl-CoA hydratase/carnithine racemase